MAGIMAQKFRTGNLFFLAFLGLSACKPMPAPPPVGYETMAPPRSASAPMPSYTTPLSSVEVSSRPTAPVPPPPASVTPPPPAANHASGDVKIGLLLPLSGGQSAPSQSVLGQAMLDAGNLALFDKFDSLNATQRQTGIALLPKDTAGESGPGGAAKQAIADGATILLGPLFSDDAEAVGEIARGAGVPVLTFSNNKQIAGRGVYVLGITPENQAARMASFLYSHKFTRVAALLPSDPYGQALSKALIDTAQQMNKPAPTVEYYTPGAAAEAVDAMAAALSADPKQRPQALLLAESGDALKAITDALIANKIDLRVTRLVGVGKWEDGPSQRNPALQGAWFAGSDAAPWQAFQNKYRGQYGIVPPKQAALAYDAVALAASLAFQPGGFSAAALQNRGGFTGPATGLFRLNEDGTNTRGLTIYEIAPNGARVLDPAPKAF